MQLDRNGAGALTEPEAESGVTTVAEAPSATIQTLEPDSSAGAGEKSDKADGPTDFAAAPPHKTHSALAEGWITFALRAAAPAARTYFGTWGVQPENPELRKQVQAWLAQQ